MFKINDLHATVRFKELANDMKMLAMLGGELSNAAIYFSLFGNAKMTTLTCKEALEVMLHVSGGHGLFNKGLR